MQDIFLSYSTQDRERLEPLVKALEAQGWSVFWDHRSIKVSQEWHDVIGTAIQSCPCVIVAWSQASITSRWVKEEALIARDRGVLYPILLDTVPIPFGFNMIQAGNFIAWDGKVTHPEFVELREQLALRLDLRRVEPVADLPDVEVVVPETPEPEPVKPAVPERPEAVQIGSFGKGGKSVLALAVVVGLAVLGFSQVDTLMFGFGSGDDQSASNGMESEAVAPTATPEVQRLAFEPEMVKIPAGTFTMGCVKGRDDVNGECGDSEKPPHEVEVAEFWMSETEITVGQFRKFVNSTGYKTEAEKKNSCFNVNSDGEWGYIKGNFWDKLVFEQTDQHPVTCVSWNDAQAYVRWLSKSVGRDYRLPSEAQWEYAARAGSKTAYFWGDDINQGCQFANVADQEAKAVYADWTWVADCSDGHVYTAPVGSFGGNSFGLKDMNGNIWEWVEDCYQGDYQGASKQGFARIKCEGDVTRVLRGGSWFTPAHWASSSMRDGSAPDTRDAHIGFRIISPPPQDP